VYIFVSISYILRVCQIKLVLLNKMTIDKQVV